MVGLPLDEADTYLKGRDLQIGIIEIVSDTTDELVFVVRQKPSEGKQVIIGDLIDLWIAPETDSLYQQILLEKEAEEEQEQE